MPEPSRKRNAGKPHLPALPVGPTSGRATRRLVTTERLSSRAIAPERRDPASRDALLRRIVAEYAEMPGLCLTGAQRRRLFGLRDDISERVFSALVDAGVLRQDSDGLYWRTGE